MRSKNHGVSGAAKLVLVAGTVASIAAPLMASPRGERVVRGNVQFNRNGNYTTITASNGAIINYSQFNILTGETVQFVQPNSRARVLNRVLAADPTTIAGTLLANGRVYIVNPAGVSIRNGAVVDVGGLYAAAGNISDNDFARGINRFTNLTGEVRNDGMIRGAEVVLIGANVINAGTIDAPQGLVALAAGSDILIGEAGSTMYVRVDAATLGQEKMKGGVENTGEINAAGGTYIAGTGDLFGMTIRQGGKVTATNVNIDGGNRTLTWVDGTIDASGNANRQVQGGSVTVLGEQVVLAGTAVIDASGPNSGGVVQMGGGLRGVGTARNADLTFIAQGAVVRADATENGKGGTIVAWSDRYTEINGELSAAGAGTGDGGLIETSSKVNLNIAGQAKVNASAGADGGVAGRWLLDPLQMSIVNGAGSSHLFTSGGNPERFEPDDDGNPATVGLTLIENTLNSGTDVEVNTDAGGTADVTQGDIIWSATQNLNVTSAGRDLVLSANSDINFVGALTITGAGASSLMLTFNAGADTGSNTSEGVDANNVTTISGPINLGGADFTATGNDFQVTQTGSIAAPGGGLHLLYIGDINIQGQLSTTGSDELSIGAGASSITITNPGSASITSTTGDIHFNGPTTLTGSPTIDSTAGLIEFLSELTINDAQTIGSAATNDVHFDGDIHSQDGENNNLTVNAFNINVHGDVGDLGPDMGILTFNLAPGGRLGFDTDINAGEQDLFATQVTVNGDTLFEGTSGQVHFLIRQELTSLTPFLTFNGDLRSAGGDETDVSLNSDGTISINGDIGLGGAANILGNLNLADFNGASTPSVSTNVNSTSWNLRSLTADTLFRVINGGLALNIAADSSTFSQEVRSESHFTDLSFSGVGFTNNVEFQANVGDEAGSDHEFASLRVAGNTTVWEITIATDSLGGTGDQTYEGAFLVDNQVLGTNATLQVHGTGSVVFQGTVDDNSNSGGLFVIAQNVNFQGLIGETVDELDRLDVTAREDILLSFPSASILTTPTQGIQYQEFVRFTAPTISLGTAGSFLIHDADLTNGGSVEFNGFVQDIGNATDALYIDAGVGNVLFNGDVGDVNGFALGRLVVTAATTEFRSTVVTDDFGGGDGDQIYNTNVILNDALRQVTHMYVGSVVPGTDPDAAVDGHGDISYRGEIQSFSGLGNFGNQNLLVQTSGRREFHRSIGENFELASLVTGGDQNIHAPADPVANPGRDYLGDDFLLPGAAEIGSDGPIDIHIFADGSGALGSGNVDFWGPTYLRNNVHFDLNRSFGLFGTTDVPGERQLTFQRTLDTFDVATRRTLFVDTAFRVWFKDNVGAGNTAGGLVPTAGRLQSADVSVSDQVAFGGTPADAWIRLGSFNDTPAGSNNFSFLTFAPGNNSLGQRFNGPVLLDADTVVDDDNNGDIIFENTVDSFDTLARDLDVNTGGRGHFRNNVGKTNALDELTTDSDQATATDGTVFGFNGNAIEIHTVSSESGTPFGAHGSAAIDIRDRALLDGDVLMVPLNDGGVHFHDTVDTEAVSLAVRSLIINSSGTVQFFTDIGATRPLSHLETDAPGFTRFGDQEGAGTAVLRIFTSGTTTDIGDPVSLDADLQVTELDGDGVIRFRNTINSFDDNFRAISLLTPFDPTANGGLGAAARTELWRDIGTNFGQGNANVPNDAVDRSLRFIQTDGVGVTQIGNNSDLNLTQGPASVTWQTNGDPTLSGVGILTSNGSDGDPDFPAIDMQDAALLDASLTLLVQNNQDVRFYETIDSVNTTLNSSNRSLTINNGTGRIALDDNIGLANRLLFILTDTDAAGSSGSIRLGNNSGLNGAADGATMAIRTSGVGGVQMGDQFIDIDSDVTIDAINNGVVNFGANANTGKVNSLDRSTFAALSPSQIYRGLTVNTGGNTRFFNTIGQQSFTLVGGGLRRLGFLTTDEGTTGLGAGSTRFDSDVWLQGRDLSVVDVPGQQRRKALTLNDPTIVIGDNTEVGTTINGVTFDSNIVGSAVTGTGGGAMRFRGNIVTDGISRNLNILTNAQAMTRGQFFLLSEADREHWVEDMLAPVAFGGSVGGAAGGARFSTFTINQPGVGPFGLRGTGLNSDINNVPAVATIVWAGRTAFSTGDEWSLDRDGGSVGPLDSAANTPNFNIFTTGRIDFGQNEKGTAFGNLSLLSSGGQIVIGDLNAVGAKGHGGTSGRLIVGESGNTFVESFSQKKIMVRTRTDARVVKFDDGILRSFKDMGVDFVGNYINFRFTPARVAPGTNIDGHLNKHRIQFATPSGDNVTIAGDNTPEFIVRLYPEPLFPDQFVNGSDDQVFFFDLFARGISQAQRATAWSTEGWNSAPHEVWPEEMTHFERMTDLDQTVPDPVTLSEAERKALSDIGVLTRKPTSAEMLNNLVGRDVYNDRPSGVTGQAEITVTRLNYKAAHDLAAESQRLLSAGGGDLSKANSLIDQLGVTPAEGSALKASLASRFGGMRPATPPAAGTMK